MKYTVFARKNFMVCQFLFKNQKTARQYINAMMLPEARMAPWDLPALRTAAAAAPLPTRRSPPPPPGRTPAPAAPADQQWRRSEPPLLRRLRGRGCRPRSGCPGLRSCRRFAGEAATSLEICVKNPSGIPECFCSCTYRSTLICREKN